MHENLQDFLTATAAELGVPGAIIGVLDGEREIVAVTGVASTETGAPVTERTLFQIGSTSKTFTGTAAMRLIEDGLLHLDDRVVDILPDFRLADADALAALRVRHLLTHSGGFLGDSDERPGWDDEALARNMEDYADLPQFFAPGTIASYSNAGVRLLGRVIEKVTGETYEQAVQRIVLDPLGLKDTLFFPWEVIARPHALGHVAAEDGSLTPMAQWPLTRDINPEGGIVSSIGDQLRYARFHLYGDALGAERAPVNEETRLRMQQPQIPAGPPVDGIGFPWLLSHHGDARLVMHGGNISDTQLSEFVLAPDQHLAIVVLTNSGAGKALGTKAIAWCLEHFRSITTAPEPAELLAADILDDVAGRYDAGQWHYEVTRDDDALRVEMVLREDIAALGIPPRPPLRLRVRSDRALITDDGTAIGRLLNPDEGGPDLLHIGLRAVRRA